MPFAPKTATALISCPLSGFAINVSTRLILAVALGFVLNAGRAVAAVLLADDFSGAAVDTTKWTTNIPTVEYNPGKKVNSSIVQSSGQVNISGRAYLTTKNQFTGPIQVSGDATFTDIVGGDWSGIGPGGLGWTLKDAEFLSVQLRTSGVPNASWFREATDGLDFRVTVAPNPAGGMFPTILNIIQHSSPNSSTVNMQSLAPLQSSVLNLVQGDSIHFTITDDGQKVAFTVAKIVGGVPSDTILETLTTAAPVLDPKSFVSFYDREAPNAGNPRTVTLDNVTIAQVPESAVMPLLLLAIGLTGGRRRLPSRRRNKRRRETF